MKAKQAIAAFLAALSLPLAAREVVDLSGDGWSLWRDVKADWRSESVVVPGTPLDKVQVHEPTGGWKALDEAEKKSVSVPGTVEQYCTDMSKLKEKPMRDIADFWYPLRGVSWWVKTFQVPEDIEGKRLVLRFEAARHRAEVFLDRKLVAVDQASDTPFEIDVTGKLKAGDKAELAVRITNPGGDYDWMDYVPIVWNGVKIHGGRCVGGITGKVSLNVLDPVYIDDVFVMNKPDPRTIEVRTTIRNTTDSVQKAELATCVVEEGADKKLVPATETVELQPGDNVVSRTITLPDAKLWDIDSPNLYRLVAQCGNDVKEQTFGFRWFAPEGIGENAIFRLNGRRVRILSALSWGWWPTTGIIPTPEYAAKQVATAKKFGLNSLFFHRHMGQPLLLQEADRQGLMYHGEPGSFVGGSHSPEGKAIMKERVLRMVKMFRSHPSFVFYDLINEQWGDSKDYAWYQHMVEEVHKADPTRVVALTSAWGKQDYNVEDMAKMHARPYDPAVYKKGWCDHHQAWATHTSYPDYTYVNPNRYICYSNDRPEIMIWGEEAPMSSPPRLTSIAKEIDKIGQTGMDGEAFLLWKDAMERYLDKWGLRKVFPTIDEFGLMLGKPAMLNQAHRIENVRMGDVGDGYMISGFEAMLRDNNCGIADIYRNPKGDPAIIRQAANPLRLVVRVPERTFAIPAEVTPDVYIINEKDLKGEFTLKVEAVIDGKVVASDSCKVKVTGGETYGELLKEKVALRIRKPGVGFLRASLVGTDVKGCLEFHALDTTAPQISKSIAILTDNGGFMDFMKKSGFNVSPYDPNAKDAPDILILDKKPRPAPFVLSGDQISDPDGRKGVLRATFRHFGETLSVEDVKKSEMGIPHLLGRHRAFPQVFRYNIDLDGFWTPKQDGLHVLKVEGADFGDPFTLEVDGKKMEMNVHNEAPIKVKAGVPLKLHFSMLKNQTGHFKIMVYEPDPNPIDVKAIFDLAKNKGTRILVLWDTVEWMPYVAQAAGVRYRGAFDLGYNWIGGHYFNIDHPVFDGFAVKRTLDYPFNKVAGGKRTGLWIEGEGVRLIAGAWHSVNCKLGVGVGSVKCGKGSILFSTLNIISNLNDPAAQRMLFNLLKYASAPAK